MDDHFGNGKEWGRKGVRVVSFDSPACRTCRHEQPIMRALARRFKGRVKIVDLDIDENRHLANQLVIASIPTLIIFKNGKEMRRFVGLQAAEVLSKAITEVLNA